MVRLKDIAEHVGVSVMTVSKALRDEPDVSPGTKTRIKLAAQQMGYVPDSSAQGLRTRTTKLFGLVVSSCADPFLSRVVLAIEQCSYEMGYDVLLAQNANIPEREEACIRRFLSRRVDGIFLAPVARMSTEAPIFRELHSRGIPTVILGPPPPYCAQFPNVTADDVLAGYAVTQHLLQLGHRRIAFFTGPLPSIAEQARFEGYRRGLSEVGLDLQDRFVFQAGKTIEDGEKAAKQMLSERCDATAVQAVNDLVAVGCMRELHAQGIRIPQDISVAGFGNIPLSDSVLTPLSTISQPKHRLGVAAAAAMLQLLRGKQPENGVLPAELIVRASTGRARASAI
jgi:DNA-binding LacI/PurR family transcriptional regulator